MIDSKDNKILPSEALHNLEITEIRNLIRKLDEFYRTILQKGVDYDTIPGTPKPTLLKPGAELLLRFFDLRSEIKNTQSIENTDPNNPYFQYNITIAIYNKHGEKLGEGLGSANSKETKFAFRWVQEKYVPSNLDKKSLEKREENGKVLYKIPTPPNEIFSMANTIMKMAQKRALISAVLMVTGASRIFTQDLEDLAENEIIQPPENRNEPTKMIPRNDAFTKADKIISDFIDVHGLKIGYTINWDIPELRIDYINDSKIFGDLERNLNRIGLEKIGSENGESIWRLKNGK
jgi:hypothetical protein